MNKSKQNKLFKKYSKIFRQKDLSPQESAMSFGIACGDGWYDIIDILCYYIQTYVDAGNIEQVEAVQVKSKWGTLRFYVNNTDDYIRGMIRMAEGMSERTPEMTPKEVFYKKGETLPPTGESSFLKKCISLGELKI